MLAHKAEEEGVACVEGISGHSVDMDYNSIPNVIYTHPEVAWVGLTEKQAKESLGKFPLSSNGRSRAVSDYEGLVKVITEASTDKLIGAHIIAPCAGELINQFSMALLYGASAEDISRTVAECVKEACLSAYFGKPINSI